MTGAAALAQAGEPGPAPVPPPRVQDDAAGRLLQRGQARRAALVPLLLLVAVAALVPITSASVAWWQTRAAVAEVGVPAQATVTAVRCVERAHRGRGCLTRLVTLTYPVGRDRETVHAFVASRGAPADGLVTPRVGARLPVRYDPDRPERMVGPPDGGGPITSVEGDLRTGLVTGAGVAVLLVALAGAAWCAWTRHLRAWAVRQGTWPAEVRSDGSVHVAGSAVALHSTLLRTPAAGSARLALRGRRALLLDARRRLLVGRVGEADAERLGETTGAAGVLLRRWARAAGA